MPGGAGTNPLLNDQETLEFLKKQSQGAKYITSVCTGALVLGAAGLLNGKRATTHWMYHDMLPELGAIPVQERYVIDGNVVTGGGVTAGIDFALAIAADLHGEAVAKAIQLSIEYDPAPPFASGSPDRAAPELVARTRETTKARQHERLEAVQRAAAKLATLADPITVTCARC